jgi:hypothetical protein
LKEAIDAPWKAYNEARRLGAAPLIRLAFAAKGVAWGKRWRIFGMPRLELHRGSSQEITRRRVGLKAKVLLPRAYVHQEGIGIQAAEVPARSLPLPPRRVQVANLAAQKYVSIHV